MEQDNPQISNNGTSVVTTPAAPDPSPVAQSVSPNVAPVASAEKSPVIRSVERVTVWIMVLSAIMFALISIMAIWGVLGDNNGEILGRSLGTIAVIAFTALVINIGANMLDRSKKN